MLNIGKLICDKMLVNKNRLEPLQRSTHDQHESIFRLINENPSINDHLVIPKDV